ERPYYGYPLAQLTNPPGGVYYSKPPPMYQAQASWTPPHTIRLLFDADALYNHTAYPPPPRRHDTPDQAAYPHLRPGHPWRNYATPPGPSGSHKRRTRAGASCVARDHAFKARFSSMHRWACNSSNVDNSGMTLHLRIGVHAQSPVFAPPLPSSELLY